MRTTTGRGTRPPAAARLSPPSPPPPFPRPLPAPPLFPSPSPAPALPFLTLLAEDGDGVGGVGQQRAVRLQVRGQLLHAQNDRVERNANLKGRGGEGEGSAQMDKKKKIKRSDHQTQKSIQRLLGQSALRLRRLGAVPQPRAEWPCRCARTSWKMYRMNCLLEWLMASNSS